MFHHRSVTASSSSRFPFYRHHHQNDEKNEKCSLKKVFPRFFCILRDYSTKNRRLMTEDTQKEKTRFRDGNYRYRKQLNAALQ